MTWDSLAFDHHILFFYVVLLIHKATWYMLFQNLPFKYLQSYSTLATGAEIFYLRLFMERIY